MLPTKHKQKEFQRPKRKERSIKHSKSCSSKPKRSCGNDRVAITDATHKLKQEFKNKENPKNAADKTLLSLVTQGRIVSHKVGKVGLYSKGKLSNTIRRRRVLATIQSSDVRGVKQPDLKHDTTPINSDTIVSTPPPPPDIGRHRNRLNKKKITNISLSKPLTSLNKRDRPRRDTITSDTCTSDTGGCTSDTGGCTSDISSCTSDTCCSTSSPVDSIEESLRIVKISQDIMSGLEHSEIFVSLPSPSEYLKDVCYELKKSMKQSDPIAFGDLERCFCKGSDSNYQQDSAQSVTDSAHNTLDSTHNTLDSACNIAQNTLDATHNPFDSTHSLTDYSQLTPMTDNEPIVIDGTTLANEGDVPIVNDGVTNMSSIEQSSMDTSSINVSSSPIQRNYWMPMDKMLTGHVPSDTTCLLRAPLHRDTERYCYHPMESASSSLLSSTDGTVGTAGTSDGRVRRRHSSSIVRGDFLDTLSSSDEDGPRMYRHKLY